MGRLIFSANPAKLAFVIISVFCLAHTAVGQESCLTELEISNMVAQVKSRSTKATLNKKLRDELLEFSEQLEERTREDIRDRKPDALMKSMQASREKNTARLCRILKQYGWPMSGQVGKEGVEAAFFVLRNNASARLKIELHPVIVAAANAGEISRASFASYVDRLRLEAGLKQLFGTQATILDGFLVLFPIESESQVDVRRKQYDLPPLAEYVRFLQVKYRMPLMKSTGALTNRFSDKEKNSIAASSATLFDGEAVEDDQVVSVDTNLVSLNVSVYSTKLRTAVNTLSQNDFTVSEDGHDQTISYFATMDAPFDLVLLIDLSGSTAAKRKLIRKSTERFVEATRPLDRVSIVTFSSTTKVLSPLTNDRAKLLASINGITDELGASHVWDALKFSLDEVIGPKTLARRRAVVFMTDGVDNALSGWGRGSTTTFADLLETVRSSDCLVVPIFLDTENDDYYVDSHRLYDNARRTLQRLADESGGLFYKAKKIEDLNGVYGQVIADLGKIYSLGYKPTNEKRDGTWRTVKIQLPNLPDVSTRARPGYYAN